MRFVRDLLGDVKEGRVYVDWTIIPMVAVIFNWRSDIRQVCRAAIGSGWRASIFTAETVYFALIIHDVNASHTKVIAVDFIANFSWEGKESKFVPTERTQG